MPGLSFVAMQVRGKLRRYVQANLIQQDNDSLAARRQGECNRCGACCKIVFRCPFLGTDEQGEYTCRIYEQRFAQCRLFPLHARDLLEVPECSFTFPDDPRPASQRPAVAGA
jgi:Fe-S-cluster containining protein